MADSTPLKAVGPSATGKGIGQTCDPQKNGLPCWGYPLSLLFNSLLHVVILLTFLTFFFFYYIAPLTSEHVDKEVKSATEDYTRKLLLRLDQQQLDQSTVMALLESTLPSQREPDVPRASEDYTRQILMQMEPPTQPINLDLPPATDLTGTRYRLPWANLQALAEQWQQEAAQEQDENETTNAQLFQHCLIAIAVLAGVTLVYALYLAVFKRVDIKVGTVLLENLIIFSLVGLVEFYFFKNIASRYVPVMPDEAANVALQKIRDNVAALVEEATAVNTAAPLATPLPSTVTTF